MRKLKSKKGVLFTLGLTFLALIVLALAILIFHNSQDYEELIAKLSVLDRVYDLDTSIQQSLRDIFYLKSGISINVSGNGVTFEEVLPNPNMRIFNSSMSTFRRFVESNLSNINLTITDIGKVPLRVTPSNIVYTHRENWGNIEVVPTTLTTFDGYSLVITTDRNVSLCTWDVGEVMGSLSFSLEVKGDAVAIDCGEPGEPKTEQINPFRDNEVRVESIEEGNFLIIKIGNRGGFGIGNNDGRLLINRTKDIPIRAKTTILTNQGEGVRADSIVLGIDFSDFGVYKGSGIRIA